MVWLVQNAQFEHCLGTNLKPKVVQSDRTSVLATSIMLHREEVGRPLQRPVQLPLTSEVQNGNLIDRSFGGVFARWRGLGIPSLAQLARSQDERVTTVLEPICGIYERSPTLEIDPRTLFRFPELNQST